MKIKLFVSATEAKNGFGGVLDALADGPVGIEKNGKPVAVMLSAERFDALQQFELFESLRNQVLERQPSVLGVLRAYKDAKLSSRDAALKLGLSDTGRVLDLMGFAQLGIPEIPEDMLCSQIESLQALRAQQ